uniref:Costars domain-containing protein n=1 Tax=Salix viminalis TaxID=40686 RepID=A0A6N2N370_SALVM
MNVEEEVGRLKEEIQRLGKVQPDGSYKVTFGVLFNDDRCANIFEALVGTLRAAKRRKVLTYDGELLLQGVHDNVEIILKAAPLPASEVAANSAVKN